MSVTVRQVPCRCDSLQVGPNRRDGFLKSFLQEGRKAKILNNDLIGDFTTRLLLTCTKFRITSSRLSLVLSCSDEGRKKGASCDERVG